MGNRLLICKRNGYKGTFAPKQGKENENCEEYSPASKNEAKNKSLAKSKKVKTKEDKKTIDDIKKKEKVKMDKESKSMKQKRYIGKNKKKKILDDNNHRNEMSWERVIEICDMENPDTEAVLEAWDTALKLSRDTFKEKEELVKQSMKLGNTQRQARDTKKILVMRLKEEKSAWQKLKENSDKYSGKKYQEAADEACKNYKKTTKDLKMAEKFANDTLESFLKLQNTIAEKKKKYNQIVQKINVSVARLQESEKRDLSITKKHIGQEGKILKEATKLKDDHIDMMNKAVKTAEDAKQKFIKMEDKVAFAREEYDKEVNKICCGKKKLKELNKCKGLTEYIVSEMKWNTYRVDTNCGVDTDSKEKELTLKKRKEKLKKRK